MNRKIAENASHTSMTLFPASSAGRFRSDVIYLLVTSNKLACAIYATSHFLCPEASSSIACSINCHPSLHRHPQNFFSEEGLTTGIGKSYISMRQELVFKFILRLFHADT